MNTKLENVLDEFCDDDQTQNLKNLNINKDKKVVLSQREGLIERVDRIFVTSDGRQLLREQY